MSFYEHTIITKHDLSTKDIEDVKKKYTDIINNTDGKLIKTEEWGLLSFSNKINNSKKGFYIHFKFQGTPVTVAEIKKKTKLDEIVIRDLIVKYKKLDTNKEYFNKSEKE
tara:strand:+ start:1028 stop:1357 length:330 start_codon:yes stop_codon:yes gene_type:complete